MSGTLLCAILLGLLVAADEADGGEPKVAVAVTQNGEAFVIDATIEVEVPLATAWAVLTDFDNMATILGNLTSSKITSRDGDTWTIRQEGVAKFGLLSFSFFSEREIRLEPMRRILAKNLAGTLKRAESEARIAVVDQGVRITYHAESVPDSVLARLFGASFARREAQEQFLAMSREMVRRHEK